MKIVNPLPQTIYSSNRRSSAENRLLPDKSQRVTTDKNSVKEVQSNVQSLQKTPKSIPTPEEVLQSFETQSNISVKFQKVNSAYNATYTSNGSQKTPTQAQQPINQYESNQQLLQREAIGNLISVDIFA